MPKMDLGEKARKYTGEEGKRGEKRGRIGGCALGLSFPNVPAHRVTYR